MQLSLLVTHIVQMLHMFLCNIHDTRYMCFVCYTQHMFHVLHTLHLLYLQSLLHVFHMLHHESVFIVDHNAACILGYVVYFVYVTVVMYIFHFLLQSNKIDLSL